MDRVIPKTAELLELVAGLLRYAALNDAPVSIELVIFAARVLSGARTPYAARCVETALATTLNRIAERQSHNREAPSVYALLTGTPSKAEEETLRSTLAQLERRGLVAPNDGTYIQLTVEGWLESDQGAVAAKVIEAATALFRDKARAGEDPPRLDWEGLRSKAQLDDDRMLLAFSVLTAGLLHTSATRHATSFNMTATVARELWWEATSIAEFTASLHQYQLEISANGGPLSSDERNACELLWTSFLETGEWPSSGRFSVRLHDAGIDFTKLLQRGSVFRLRGSDRDARAYLALPAVALVKRAAPLVSTIVKVCRTLGDYYADDPDRAGDLSARALISRANLDEGALVVALRALEPQGWPFSVSIADDLTKATIAAREEFLGARKLEDARDLLTWIKDIWPAGPPRQARFPVGGMVPDQALDDETDTRHLTGGEEPRFPPPKQEDEPTTMTLRRSLRRLGPFDVLLVTANQIERTAVLRRMRPLSRGKAILKIPWKDQSYYVGLVGQSRVALVMSRIGAGGRDGAGFTIDEAIAECQPRCVISVGVAWGMDTTKLRIGDVLVSNRIIPFDLKRLQAGGNLYRSEQPAPGRLLFNRFRNVSGWRFERPDGVVCRLKEGALLSGDSVVDSVEAKAELHAEFRDAIGGEMEATGVYGATEKNDGEWIVVKAVCDWGDGTKHDEYQPVAAAAAVSLVEAVISTPASLADLKHLGGREGRKGLVFGLAFALAVAISVIVVSALNRSTSAPDAETNAKLLASSEEQRFETAASRPLQQLEFRFHYRAGTWRGTTSSGSTIGVRVWDEGGPRLIALLGDESGAPGFLGPFAKDFTLQAVIGDDRILIVRAIAGKRLPTMREIGRAIVGFAVTDDWFQGLESVEVIADGYRLATSTDGDLPLGLAPLGRWEFGLATAPPGTRWLGWLDPAGILIPLSIRLDPMPPRVK